MSTLNVEPHVHMPTLNVEQKVGPNIFHFKCWTKTLPDIQLSLKAESFAHMTPLLDSFLAHAFNPLDSFLAHAFNPLNGFFSTRL